MTAPACVDGGCVWSTWAGSHDQSASHLCLSVCVYSANWFIHTLVRLNLWPNGLTSEKSTSGAKCRRYLLSDGTVPADLRSCHVVNWLGPLCLQGRLDFKQCRQSRCCFICAAANSHEASTTVTVFCLLMLNHSPSSFSHSSFLLVPSKMGQAAWRRRGGEGKRQVMEMTVMGSVSFYLRIVQLGTVYHRGQVWHIRLSLNLCFPFLGCQTTSRWAPPTHTNPKCYVENPPIKPYIIWHTKFLILCHSFVIYHLLLASQFKAGFVFNSSYI